MRAREALALADATRVAIAQELTKQATEKTKQEACGVPVLPERLEEEPEKETATKKRRRQRKKSQLGQKNRRLE